MPELRIRVDIAMLILITISLNIQPPHYNDQSGFALLRIPNRVVMLHCYTTAYGLFINRKKTPFVSVILVSFKDVRFQ